MLIVEFWFKISVLLKCFASSSKALGSKIVNLQSLVIAIVILTTIVPLIINVVRLPTYIVHFYTYKMGIVIKTVHLVIDKALFKKNRVQRHISESISKKTASISLLTRSISKKTTSVCIFHGPFAYFMVQANKIKELYKTKQKNSAKSITNF